MVHGVRLAQIHPLGAAPVSACLVGEDLGDLERGEGGVGTMEDSVDLSSHGVDGPVEGDDAEAVAEDFRKGAGEPVRQGEHDWVGEVRVRVVEAGAEVGALLAGLGANGVEASEAGGVEAPGVVGESVGDLQGEQFVCPAKPDVADEAIGESGRGREGAGVRGRAAEDLVLAESSLGVASEISRSELEAAIARDERGPAGVGRLPARVGPRHREPRPALRAVRPQRLGTALELADETRRELRELPQVVRPERLGPTRLAPLAAPLAAPT
eukprot:CAMPEP_0197400964 /NCGR_PEP_ID=MMETSP1165-20131217/17699_1 /TAXON_ID=284809 /ORGANISM="Chrysocystis fragilis, Strain CCMP3189" /LENGTH=268 /DNA_ID=CAMNT_0042927055 /DNA_START=151 /DNA_END=953 /DNA_ORIENTATION=-